MRSGQATGCFVSTPILFFILLALIFKIHLHWFWWICILTVLSQTLGLFFHGDENNTNEPEWKSDSDDLKDGIIHEINGHTQMLTSGRRRFIISKDRDGNAYCQEVNTKNNTWGKKVYAENNEELADYIKRKINSGE